jgi:3-(3-hydroxy-phenyl)propionate hydroxylase
MTHSTPHGSTESVIVAGAGPVGLTCALSLAGQGVPVTVLERERDVFRAPRAMGYHWSVLSGLDDLGVLDDMKARGFLVESIDFNVWPTGEKLSFSVDPLRGRVCHPYMLTLGQDQFAEVLVDHLAQYDHAQIIWGTAINSVKQESDQVEVATDVGRFSAPWLIAADGATGQTRAQVGLGFAGMTFPDNFIATNVRFDFSQLGLALNNYVIDPRLGAVVAKVTRDGLWRVTWAEDAKLPDVGLNERIHQFLTALMPGGADYELVDHSRYRMHQRAADSMRVGRILFAGDAAHATNPTSGFGLVGGLFDSYVLTEALGAVLRHEVEEKVLDRYSQDRLTAFWTVTSPQSVESKRLVFHSQDPDRLEVDLQMLRRVSADPHLLLNFWLGGSRVESPSVVSGRLLSNGRNSAV